MSCIKSLRNKLLILPEDTVGMARCKKVFQSVSVCGIFEILYRKLDPPQ